LFPGWKRKKRNNKTDLDVNPCKVTLRSEEGRTCGLAIENSDLGVNSFGVDRHVVIGFIGIEEFVSLGRTIECELSCDEG
jgi:hypothetical protein